MPTAAIQTITAGKLEPFMRPELVKTQVVQLVLPSAITFYKRGTLFGQKLVDAEVPGNVMKFAPYNNTPADPVDGLESAKCILPYDIVVGTDGKYWYANSTTVGGAIGPHGEQRTNIDMYFGGCFKSDDLYYGAGHASSGAGTAPDATQLAAALVDLNATIEMTSYVGTTNITIFRF
jgi:hypothetical protein